MPTSSIDALSPLDGRYAGKLETVRHIFSEAGLMRERVRVECAWFLALAAGPAAAALAKLPPAIDETGSAWRHHRVELGPPAKKHFWRHCPALIVRLHKTER